MATGWHENRGTAHSQCHTEVGSQTVDVTIIGAEGSAEFILKL